MYCSTIYDRMKQTKTSFLNTLYVSVCVVIAMTLETATVRRPLVSECFASGQGHKLEAPWKQSKKKSFILIIHVCAKYHVTLADKLHTHTSAHALTLWHTPLCFVGVCAQRFNQLLYARIEQDLPNFRIAQNLLHPGLVGGGRLTRVRAAAHLQLSPRTCLTHLHN